MSARKGVVSAQRQRGVVSAQRGVVSAQSGVVSAQKGGGVQGVAAITLRREVWWTIMILNSRADDQALALF